MLPPRPAGLLLAGAIALPATLLALRGLAGETAPVARRPTNAHVWITDSPARVPDVDAVLVTLEPLELLAEDGTAVPLASPTGGPTCVDLMNVRDGRMALVGAAHLAPGRYGRLRLRLVDATVVRGDRREPLRLRTDSFDLPLHLVVREKEKVDMVVDVDALTRLDLERRRVVPIVQLAGLTGG